MHRTGNTKIEIDERRIVEIIQKRTLTKIYTKALNEVFKRLEMVYIFDNCNTF